MAKEFKLSAERLEEPEQELNYLKIVREKKTADQTKGTRSFDDLSENSEYDEAKNKQDKLYSHITGVENILVNYVVTKEHETDPNPVCLGPKAKILGLGFKEEGSCRAVGSQKTDPMNGRISGDSSFGKALLGNAVGNKVQVEAPAGVLKYHTLEIQK